MFEHISSKTSTSGFFSKDLANDIFCFSPPDRFVPPISISSSSDFFSSMDLMNWFCVKSMWLPSSKSSRRFFLSEPLTIGAFCTTYSIRSLMSSFLHLSMSMPFTLIILTSLNFTKPLAKVLLPLPLAPLILIMSPFLSIAFALKSSFMSLIFMPLTSSSISFIASIDSFPSASLFEMSSFSKSFAISKFLFSIFELVIVDTLAKYKGNISVTSIIE